MSTIGGGNYVDLSMSMKRRKRRLWDDVEKRRIAAQTRVPGVSVSQVARRYDVNANLVLKWRRDPRFTPTPVEDCAASFLPVEVVAAAAPRLIDPPVVKQKALEAKSETSCPTAIVSAWAARMIPTPCAVLCAA